MNSSNNIFIRGKTLNKNIAFFSEDENYIHYFTELLCSPFEGNSYLDVIANSLSLDQITYFSDYEKFHRYTQENSVDFFLIVDIKTNPTSQKIYEKLRVDINFTDTPILSLSLIGSEKDTDDNDDSIFDFDPKLHFVYFPIWREELIMKIDKAVSEKKYVLLVDDSKIIHQMIDEVLSANNFRIMNAYNGWEGLEFLKKCKPDIIISDIEMPEMDGYEFCKAIKNSTHLEHIPVMILSSLDSNLDIDRGFEAGANDYLTKPINNDELVSRIQNLLQKNARSVREKILVVDDSSIVSSMLYQGLKQQGFRVFTAVNGMDGLAKAREINPDLITSDYDMPVMNGWEFCTALRREDALKDIPVIMLTSRDSTVDKRKSTGAGVKAYLTKPFPIEKLLVVIEKVLAEKRIDREREILKFYFSDVALASAKQQSLHNISSSSMRAKEIYATVLFSDIVKFTSTCEMLEPVDLINLLNDYFDLMCTVLKRNNAIIDKFIGDAIMAIFSDKDGSYQAVKSGLEMVEALKEFNLNQKVPIQIRIGINYGKLYIGDIGSKTHRKDFTVIGDTVNVGQRLESNSKTNGVLISESTYEVVKDFIDAEKKGPLNLKGKMGEYFAYDVIRVREKIDLAAK